MWTRLEPSARRPAGRGPGPHPAPARAGRVWLARGPPGAGQADDGRVLSRKWLDFDDGQGCDGGTVGSHTRATLMSHAAHPFCRMTCTENVRPLVPHDGVLMVVRGSADAIVQQLRWEDVVAAALDAELLAVAQIHVSRFVQPGEVARVDAAVANRLTVLPKLRPAMSEGARSICDNVSEGGSAAFIACGLLFYGLLSQAGVGSGRSAMQSRSHCWAGCASFRRCQHMMNGTDAISIGGGST